MSASPFSLDAAVACIDKLHRVRGAGANEAVVRHTLTEALADIYPVAVRPWWVRQQIQGAERTTRWLEAGEQRRGWADTVVGATAIEYESDLTRVNKLTTGRHQVAQYCAALLNDGITADDIIGVLSDGVEWYAYRLTDVTQRAPGNYAVEDLSLVEVEHLAIQPRDKDSAFKMIAFFDEYLARDEKAPLVGAEIAAHLGLTSELGGQYLRACVDAIARATSARPNQAQLIDEVWEKFEGYLRGGAPDQEARNDAYAKEFYLSILGRLVCANIIAVKALHSDADELTAILRGEFFEDRGLTKLIEHDFFGWLNRPGLIEPILEIARSVQVDLRSYNFSRLLDTDLFGTLMSQLADGTQRQLLGQEMTPAWLASQMAERLISSLPDGHWPQFVDVCVGSGAMVGAVCEQVHQLLKADGIQPGDPEAVSRLSQAVSGFDVDPLAALLAKVNWVAVNRDWLALDGSRPVSVPIYNADSLFALAPLWGERDPQAVSDRLRLDTKEIELPRFLIGPGFQELFDGVVANCTSVALAYAAGNTHGYPAQQTVIAALEGSVAESGAALTDARRILLEDFVAKYTEALTDLEREDRDGVWAFILRNSYRPGLVTHQFNGLITNPPWLAMSRLADNPFNSVLSRLADRFHLRPSGSTFLHLEMATVFLAYAVTHYLADEAVVGCVLPETVTTGSQHDSLRQQLSGRMDDLPLPIAPSELWLVDRTAFATLATVLIGSKGNPVFLTTLPSAEVSPAGRKPGTLHVARLGNRFVWSEQPPGAGIPGGYGDGLTTQGADLMPRRLVAVTVVSENSATVTFEAPRRGEPEWYLYSDAHKHEDYVISRTTVPLRFRHKMWLSKHLLPFYISPPADIVIPAVRDADGILRQADAAALSAAPRAKRHFDAILEESHFASLTEFWQRGLNMRSKLERQNALSDMTGFLVMYGAGGEIPTATFVPLDSFSAAPPLLDQTIYWTVVDSEDEAVYMCGVVNHPKLAAFLRPFLPEGAFGGRHIHTLPPKATPKYDAANPNHVDVVTTTRLLVKDFRVELAKPANEARFQLNKALQRRRTDARKIISELPSFAAFDAAVSKLFPAGGPDLAVERADISSGNGDRPCSRGPNHSEL